MSKQIDVEYVKKLLLMNGIRQSTYMKIADLLDTYEQDNWDDELDVAIKENTLDKWIENELRSKINDLFYKIQNQMNIKSGDTLITHEIDLDDKISSLVGSIKNILSFQMITNNSSSSEDQDAVEVSIEKLNEIIENYKPEGLFYAFSESENVWVGVDNSTGDAWTEDFQTKEDAVAWLTGSAVKDDEVEILAKDIDEFSFSYDPYEYNDTVDDRLDNVKKISASLSTGDVDHIVRFLKDIISEEDFMLYDTKQDAKELLSRMGSLLNRDFLAEHK